MPFTDWDPILRACVFAGVFLVPLLASLWVWYDTSGGIGSARWLWRFVVTGLVILTIPAVVLGAANLDLSQQDLMKTLGWLAIGSGSLALLGVLGYAIWGRIPLEEFEPDYEDLIPEPALAPAAATADKAPAAAQSDPALEVPAPATPPDAPLPSAPKQAVPTSAPSPAGAYLVVKSGRDQGRRFPIGHQVTIGRATSCDVSLADTKVSAEHAQVKREGPAYVFLDLKSTNGSFLVVEGREERLRSSQILVDGDEIRVGQTVLQFVRTPMGGNR